MVWVTTGAERLRAFPWLDAYRPWGVSPASLLEVQYLAEAGRVTVQTPAFIEAVRRDPRFVIDDVPLLALIREALDLSWTRDPFDRLLAAHSRARRTPLCTVDRVLRRHHALLVREIGAG